MHALLEAFFFLRDCVSAQRTSSPNYILKKKCGEVLPLQWCAAVVGSES
jgi:hypothetical protein